MDNEDNEICNGLLLIGTWSCIDEKVSFERWTTELWLRPIVCRSGNLKMCFVITEH